MAKYQLSNEADAEIDKLYEYSILNFGLETAREYVSSLYEKLDVLADHQSWGNDYGYIRPGLCRYEYRSHSIYYQSQGAGILIVRVLGSKQDPVRHFKR